MMIELLVLGVVVVGLSLAVYHIAQFSTKETPFEEALAEQRQQRNLDFVSSKNDRTPKKPKLTMKKVKPKKVDGFSVRLKDKDIVPIHGPTTSKPKDDATSIISTHKTQMKERNISESGTDKFVVTGTLNQTAQKSLKTVPNVKKSDTSLNSSPQAVKKQKEKMQESKHESAEKEAKGKIVEQTNEEKNKKLKKGNTKEIERKVEIVKRNDAEEAKLKKEESKSVGKVKGEIKKKEEKEVKSKKEEKEIKNKKEEKEMKNKKEEKEMKNKKEEREMTKKEDNQGDKKLKKEDSKDDKKVRKTVNREEKKEQEGKRTNKKEEAINEKIEQGKKTGPKVQQVATLAGDLIKERLSNKKGSDPHPTSVSNTPKNPTGGASTPKAALSPKKNQQPKTRQKMVLEEEKVDRILQVVEVPFRKSDTVKGHSSSPVGSPSQVKDKKKKKATDEQEDRSRTISVSDDVVSRLMPVIQRSQLSGGEVQTLIEALLNKQQLSGDNGEGEWMATGRVDPVVQLRRQLEEAESRLREQMDAHETLSAKIVDLRTELNSERGRNTTLKKQLDNAGAVLQQRLDAAAATHKEQLGVKIAELRESLNQEYQAKLTQCQKSSAREREEKLQQIQASLTEVEAQLQKSKAVQEESETQVKQLQTALAEAQQQLQTKAQEREELLATCQQYQQHLTSLKDQTGQQEATFNSRLYEAENSHSKAVMQLTQLANEKDVLQQQLSNLEGVREMMTQCQVKLKNVTLEKTDLENRLLQVERGRNDLENRLHQSEKDRGELDSRLGQSDKDRKDLEGRLLHMENEAIGHREILKNQKIEIECLKEEKDSLASQSVRPAAEGRENGDCHDERMEQQNFNHLHEEEISALTKEISRLKEESTHLRRTNDEERCCLQKLERNTKSVMLRIFPSLQEVEHLEHDAFLQKVESTAAAVKPPTPKVEVQTKIVEKIVEKVVPDPKLCQQVDQLKGENADLHKKIEELRCEKTSLEGRLESLAEANASLENSSRSLSTADEEHNDLIAKLEAENKDLTEKVANYQDILANTEALLKTLQKSVESEESTWHEKLVQKEELIRQLTADKKNLTLQVSELQSSLDKVKQAEEMESQLNCLKERLTKEEEAKGEIQEQLNKAQEQLKAANSIQVRANGPANGVDCHEDDVGLPETVSLVSSEGRGTSPQDGVSKKTKSKKGGGSTVSE